MWARRGVLAERCPRSVITAESLAWIEEFEIWRLGRTPSLLDLDARKADAFWLLEGEKAKEGIDGQE